LFEILVTVGVVLALLLVDLAIDLHDQTRFEAEKSTT